MTTPEGMSPNPETPEELTDKELGDANYEGALAFGNAVAAAEKEAKDRYSDPRLQREFMAGFTEAGGEVPEEG